MNLPALVVVTDGAGTGGRPLLDVVSAAIDGGARAVWLREKQLARPARLALAEALLALLGPLGGTLLVSSDPTIPGHGVHLAAPDPWPDRWPHPGPDPVGTGLVGRSCHSVTDVAAAAAEGCDYATLSPIFPTASKPGYGPALGPGALEGVALPTWALGGVDATNAAACLASGASGVAVMGAIMRAADPSAATIAVLRALG